MRNAIRQRLVEKVAAVSGRVYQPYMAGAKQPKPYLVVKCGGESPSNMTVGYEVPFEVWMYIERTDFNELDALANSVINALNGKDLVTEDQQVFALRYRGASTDFYDEDWKALTRRLDFVTDRIRGG